MSWKIQKINTGTGDVTMSNDSGDSFDLSIPHEHRGHSTRSQAYIESICASRDTTTAGIGVAPLDPALNLQKVSKLPWILCGIQAVINLGFIVAKVFHVL